MGTKSCTKNLNFPTRFSHENLVEKFKIFVQDFVPIRTALRTALRPLLMLRENVIRKRLF